jgi:hypothetical protein
MSMMRLLSAGRSLVGGRKPGKPLQMVDVRSLPKFGPREKKHPRSNTQHPEKDQASNSKLQAPVKDQISHAKAEAVEKAPSCKLQASPFAKAAQDKPEKIQTSNSKSQASGGVQAASSNGSVGQGKSTGLMGRLMKVKGLFTREPKAIRPVPQPIQGELSLDNVKVLRNDLSDSDFEVVTKAVPTQKAPVQKTVVKPAEQATPAPAPAEPKKIWNRVTTLIGAGHS